MGVGWEKDKKRLQIDDDSLSRLTSVEKDFSEENVWCTILEHISNTNGKKKGGDRMVPGLAQCPGKTASSSEVGTSGTGESY